MWQCGVTTGRGQFLSVHPPKTRRLRELPGLLCLPLPRWPAWLAGLLGYVALVGIARPQIGSAYKAWCTLCMVEHCAKCSKCSKCAWWVPWIRQLTTNNGSLPWQLANHGSHRQQQNVKFDIIKTKQKMTGNISGFGEISTEDPKFKSQTRNWIFMWVYILHFFERFFFCQISPKITKFKIWLRLRIQVINSWNKSRICLLRDIFQL